MAEREARRAGVARAGAPGGQLAEKPADLLPSQRVLRDGKPLPNDALETQPPKRSSSLQAIPKRKEPLGRSSVSKTNPHRSPVLKGPGRGPTGGSR